jgi:hypothetical protein
MPSMLSNLRSRHRRSRRNTTHNSFCRAIPSCWVPGLLLAVSPAHPHSFRHHPSVLQRHRRPFRCLSTSQDERDREHRTKMKREIEINMLTQLQRRWKKRQRVHWDSEMRTEIWRFKKWLCPNYKTTIYLLGRVIIYIPKQTKMFPIIDRFKMLKWVLILSRLIWYQLQVATHD